MFLPARPQEKDVPSQPVILKDETHAALPPLLLAPSRSVQLRSVEVRSHEKELPVTAGTEVPGCLSGSNAAAAVTDPAKTGDVSQAREHPGKQMAPVVHGACGRV